MGGKLQVESTPGHGSTFSLILDLSKVSGLMVAKSHELPIIVGFEGAQKTILVVDDKWVNRAVLVNLLEPLGFKIIEAADGQKGLESVHKTSPDLIITDLVMPSMDGFEFARQIRKCSEFQQLPIIAASASVFDIHQQQSLKAGCNYFLAKPIHADELLEKLKNYLGLTWIYETDTVSTQSEAIDTPNQAFMKDKTNDDAQLMGPSKEQATILLDLALMGDISGILEEIETLEPTNQQLIPFFRKIREFAKAFEEEAICKFLEQYMENEPKLKLKF